MIFIEFQITDLLTFFHYLFVFLYSSCLKDAAAQSPRHPRRPARIITRREEKRSVGCSFYEVRGHDCRKGQDGGGRKEGSGQLKVFGEKDESGSLSINAA